MKSLRSFLETIRVEHTLFALPFAYATLFLVAGGWPRAHDFAWITVAMVGARTVGMALNRIIDANIDARNPRTAGRAIPAGPPDQPESVGLHRDRRGAFRVRGLPAQPGVPLALPDPARRDDALSLRQAFHAFRAPLPRPRVCHDPGRDLAGGHGQLPRMAVVMGIGAGLWVAGFDIIYACQDVEVDRREKLHSIPADFGIARALGVSSAFHVGS